MWNQNSVTLAGRLGADAEIKTLGNDRKVATFSLAVDQTFKDRGGKWRTITNWFRIVTYQTWLIDKVIAKEAIKGRQFFVLGSLRTRSWEQDGKKQHLVEVEVDHTGGITPLAGDIGPINSVMLAGRLGANADIKTTPGDDGGKMASFSVAVERSFKTASGWKTETDWLRIVTFQSGLIDKVIAKLAVKGGLALVQGALRSRSYEQDGQQKTSVEIEVDGTGGIILVPEAKPAKDS